MLIICETSAHHAVLKRVTFAVICICIYILFGTFCFRVLCWAGMMVDPGSKRYEGQVINLGVRGGFKTQVTEIFHLRGTPAPLNEWSVKKMASKSATMARATILEDQRDVIVSFGLPKIIVLSLKSRLLFCPLKFQIICPPKITVLFAQIQFQVAPKIILPPQIPFLVPYFGIWRKRSCVHYQCLL